MNWPDFINGFIFEGLGGFFLWANVYKLWKDKSVRGIYYQAQLFWSAWGFWNCYYYAQLDQWWSFSGGLNVVTANVAWLTLAWKYRRN